MNRSGTSYLLWMGCLFGVSGLHRFYNGKPITGAIWFFTLGLLGIGQVIDLFLIPNMVEKHNVRLIQRRLIDLRQVNSGTVQPPIETVEQCATPRLTQQEIRRRLLNAAVAQGGKLSVTQGVLETGLDFEEVEATLRGMVRSGYVGVENHPATGVILYRFVEL